MEQSYSTIDVERRGHGKRYTSLFVDSLDRAGFIIDCTSTYMRPELFDLQVGDTVRWRHSDRYVQATIARVKRNGKVLRVDLDNAALLPPDFFPY